MQQGFKAENWMDEEGRPAGGVVSGTGICISWQNGPLGALGTPERKEPNGAFVEDVIDAALERLEFYQNSEFACQENALAIAHLGLARAGLEHRTRRRVNAGTEGTHEGK